MDIVNVFYQRIWNNIQESESTFFIDTHQNKKSYTDLKNNIDQIAPLFCNKKQQRTIIFAERNFDHYSAIIGTVLSENIWVPLSLETPMERNLEIIENIKPQYILTDQHFNQSTKEIFNKLKIKCFLISEILSKKSEVGFDFKAIFSKNNLAMIYHTSGSTGTPKGVKISNIGLSTAITRIVPLLEIKKEVWGDYHDLSFVISINVLFKCIYTQGTLYCASSKLEQFMPCDSLINNKVSCLVTVPSTLQRVIQNKNFKKIFLSLKTIISCGEPLPLEVMSKFIKEKKINFFNFYGSTELTTWIFYHKCKVSDLTKFEEYGYAPIGRPIFGNKIKVTDENLLLVQSPQVTPGYFGLPENSHLLFEENYKWFSTGDVVTKLDNFYICKGRYDNQIKLHGYRIHLMDIETQIKKKSDIDDCLCFLENNNKQQIISCVMITQSNFTSIQLREFLENKLPTYMMPRKVYCVKEKPLNKNGKLDRAKLKNTILKKD